MLTDRQTPAHGKRKPWEGIQQHLTKTRRTKRSPRKNTKQEGHQTVSSRYEIFPGQEPFDMHRLRFSPNSPDPPTHTNTPCSERTGDPPAPTRHCLILVCQCQHRQCRGLSLCIRIRTSWEAGSKPQISFMPLPSLVLPEQCASRRRHRGGLGSLFFDLG